MTIDYKKTWKLTTYHDALFVGADNIMDAMKTYRQNEDSDFGEEIVKEERNIYFNPDDIGTDKDTSYIYGVFLVNEKFFVIADSIEQAGEYWIHYRRINQEIKEVNSGDINSIIYFGEIIIGNVT